MSPSPSDDDGESRDSRRSRDSRLSRRSLEDENDELWSEVHDLEEQLLKLRAACPRCDARTESGRAIVDRATIQKQNNVISQLQGELKLVKEEKYDYHRTIQKQKDLIERLQAELEDFKYEDHEDSQLEEKNAELEVRNAELEERTEKLQETLVQRVEMLREDPDTLKLFDAVDADRSGDITITEIRKALMEGVLPSPLEEGGDVENDWSAQTYRYRRMAREWMKNFDDDGSASLNVREFAELRKQLDEHIAHLSAECVDLEERCSHFSRRSQRKP